MENSEDILKELNEYDKNPAATIPQSLENYLKQIAKTGYTRFPWHNIKTLFKVKLENVIADFSSVSAVETVPIMPNVEIFKYEEMKTRIFEQLESYSGVPFTIQRICELITQPYDYYKRIDKFMRGLERVMLVVTIIDPNPVPGGGLSASISNGFAPDLTFNHDSPDLPCSKKQRLDEAGTSKLAGKSSDEESGLRRPGDSLESPAKRIRISVEEDGGPCDSADQIPPPMQNGSPPGNECMATASLVSSPGTAATLPSTSAAAPFLPSTSGAGPSAPSTSGRTAAGPSTAPSTSEEKGGAEAGRSDASDSSPDDDMEIDVECTSSFRSESNSESLPKQDTREAIPETGNNATASSNNTINNEAEINLNASDENAGESSNQPTTAGSPNQATTAASSGQAIGAACSGQPTTAASNAADETDSGDVAAAMDTECGAEEGISTSGEGDGGAKSVPRGAEEGISTSGESGGRELAQPQQVETNSEAEASSQEKAEELPTEERMASEAQEIVVSSEATTEPRVDEMAGAADSSDQVSVPQQPCEAIEETAEAASISATEEAVTATAEAAVPTVEASSEGAPTLAEAAPAAASNSGEAVAAPAEEAISAAVSEESAASAESGEAMTAATSDGGAAATSDGGAAASEEAATNEAVECSEAATEEKNDSPDQSL